MRIPALNAASMLAAALWTAIGCASPPPAGASWDARVAEGELVRAREAVSAGNREVGRELGERALGRARGAAALPTMGRALYFLGDLDGDLLRLDEAGAVFDEVDEAAGAAGARIRAAELMLDGGRAALALSRLSAAEVREIRVVGDGQGKARLAARRHHQTARALRMLGRRREAAAHERQASLALTLLPDGELLDVRRAVATGRGDEAASNGRHQEALEWHARASDLARRTGDRPAEWAAVCALAEDLVALGRPGDALQHHARALALAREMDDDAAAGKVAHRALELLDALAVVDSAQRRLYQEAADAADAAHAR